MRTALVLVSHSGAAAEGTAEIARQMAPDVTVLPVGGHEGGLGTSVERVFDAVQGLAEAPGVVVLTDLGSAVLTAESVLELLDEEVAAKVLVPPAPFVEGAVAAAVAAQQGADPGAVAQAATDAARLLLADGADAHGADAHGADRDGVDAVSTGEGRATASVTLRNPLGLHARPAALVARAVAGLGVPVTIGGANGASVLELMQLGATGGQELTVEAVGPGAPEAVRTVAAMISEGFGEV